MKQSINCGAVKVWSKHELNNMFQKSYSMKSYDFFRKGKFHHFWIGLGPGLLIYMINIAKRRFIANTRIISWLLFTTMVSRKCCSICKTCYDPQNFSEMTFHNSQCAVLARGLILKERLNEEKEKAKQIQDKAKKRNSFRQLSASLTSPRKWVDSFGAYSSSILCDTRSNFLLLHIPNV